MSNAAIQGFNGRVFLCATQDGTYIEAGEITKLDTKNTTAMVDSMSFSDRGALSQIPGVASWEATMEQFLVLSDAALTMMMASKSNKTALWWKFQPAGTGTGYPQRAGQGYVADFNETQDVKGLILDTFTVKGTGVLDYTPQT